MPRPLKQGILGASRIILSKDIDKYTFMCGSNFYETDVSWSFGTGLGVLFSLPSTKKKIGAQIFIQKYTK